MNSVLTFFAVAGTCAALLAGTAQAQTEWSEYRHVHVGRQVYRVPPLPKLWLCFALDGSR